MQRKKKDEWEDGYLWDLSLVEWVSLCILSIVGLLLFVSWAVMPSPVQQ